MGVPRRGQEEEISSQTSRSGELFHVKVGKCCQMKMQSADGEKIKSQVGSARC